MALLTTALTPWPQTIMNNTGVPTLTIDANNEVAGVVFPVGKTGSIVAVHWRTLTVTVGDTVDIRLETLDATGGLTGTLWGTTTNAAQVVANGDDNVWFRTVLTAAASVTVGDILGVAVVLPGAATGNMAVLGAVQALAVSLQGFPYGVNPDRTTKVTTPLSIILEYSDGTVARLFGTLPLYPVSLVMSTATNPDEVALYITPSTPLRVVGWFAALALATGANFRINLYELGNNTPVLVSATFDGDFTNSTGLRAMASFFATSYTLKAGTTYRLAVVPLTTNSVTLRYYDGPTGTPAVVGVMGALDAKYSARDRAGTTDPDSAAWTETTSRIPILGFVIDGEGGASILNRRDNSLMVR